MAAHTASADTLDGGIDLELVLSTAWRLSIDASSVAAAKPGREVESPVCGSWVTAPGRDHSCARGPSVTSGVPQ